MRLVRSFLVLMQCSAELAHPCVLHASGDGIRYDLTLQGIWASVYQRIYVTIDDRLLFHTRLPLLLLPWSSSLAVAIYRAGAVAAQTIV